MDLQDYERLNPRCTLTYDGVDITYLTPNTHTRWRVDSLFEKEPCTIDWIASFNENEVLVDVGANVGMYTVFAALTRRVRVYAFEPESQNYALLNRNIVANNLGQRVRAYCLALSNYTALGELHLSEFVAGGSCHSLDEPVNYMLAPSRPVFTQGCFSTSLDELIADNTVPEPDHIKIDVDGFEPAVVAGAEKTIRKGKVKSLLIEINQNLDDHMRLVHRLGTWGFRHDPAQVARVLRPSGPFKGCAEYVFVR